MQQEVSIFLNLKMSLETSTVSAKNMEIKLVQKSLEDDVGNEVNTNFIQKMQFL